MVASIKNLNSSSLFWFYCRPNPGSHTHLRKALSCLSLAELENTLAHQKREPLTFGGWEGEQTKCPTAHSTYPVLGYLCDSCSRSHIKEVTSLPRANLSTQPTVNQWGDASTGLQFGCSLSTNTETYPQYFKKRPLYIYGLCQFCEKSTYEVLILFNRMPLDCKTNTYKTFTFLSGWNIVNISTEIGQLL